VRRSLLFGLVGIGFFAMWFIAKPDYEQSPTQLEWPYIITFSALLLALGFAVAQFARLDGDQLVVRTALVVAAGTVLSSVANVLEDGLRIDEAFFAFVLGTAITVLGLLALTIALFVRGRQRRFAVVPAGTPAGILLFVVAGGPLLLATWLIAAALSLAPDREVRATPSEI
jgi:hypothetical protein